MDIKISDDKSIKSVDEIFKYLLEIEGLAYLYNNKKHFLKLQKMLFVYVDPLNKKQIYKEYPLGPGYIGTILFNLGHEMKIYDQNVEFTDNYDLVNELIKFAPDIFAFSILTATYPTALEIIKILKDKGIETPILDGGIHASIFPEDCLNNSIDYVIKGEGESLGMT